MSTTFGVRIDKEVVEVAFRKREWFKWTNPLGDLLPDKLEVVAIDNSNQGVYTIADIKAEIALFKQKEHRRKFGF